MPIVRILLAGRQVCYSRDIMIGYTGNIEELTKDNSNFRQVLYTGKYMQLVVMKLNVGEEIGMEVHPTVDQFFRIEVGQAKFIVNGEGTEVKEEGVFIVPAGSEHNVINTGTGKLRLYTIYAPPNHPEGTIHATKADAEVAEAAKH
ncbi:MAG: mannose-1-phosphate guanyltransferase [uncultured bacterium]|nr:MAG: mannose-1-phosphate guanyltransferase [uncultured bacterium]